MLHLFQSPPDLSTVNCLGLTHKRHIVASIYVRYHCREIGDVDCM